MFKKQPAPANLRPDEFDYTPGALSAGRLVKAIDLQKIDPSPHQHRRHFDKDKLRGLAASIQREGLIEPIIVRPKKDRYELIAGERRFRAVREVSIQHHLNKSQTRALAKLKETSEEEVIELCKKNLPDFAVPKFVEFVSEFPKSAVGKILKHKLS